MGLLRGEYELPDGSSSFVRCEADNKLTHGCAVKFNTDGGEQWRLASVEVNKSGAEVTEKTWTDRGHEVKIIEFKFVEEPEVVPEPACESIPDPEPEPEGGGIVEGKGPDPIKEQPKKAAKKKSKKSDASGG